MTYPELLSRVAEDARRFGCALQRPCDEAGLARLRDRVRDQLRTELPEEYADLLRLTDGMNWNGLFLYPSRTAPITGCTDRLLTGLVETNLDLREVEGLDDVLVLGDDSLDLFGWRAATGEFLILDRVPCDVVETPPSFDALLSTALRRCLS